MDRVTQHHASPHNVLHTLLDCHQATYTRVTLRYRNLAKKKCARILDLGTQLAIRLGGF